MSVLPRSFSSYRRYVFPAASKHDGFISKARRLGVGGRIASMEHRELGAQRVLSGLGRHPSRHSADLNLGSSTWSQVPASITQAGGGSATSQAGVRIESFFVSWSFASCSSNSSASAGSCL